MQRSPSASDSHEAGSAGPPPSSHERSSVTPTSLRCLYLALMGGYVIYIPVSLFRSDLPLLLIDGLLLVAVLLTAGAARGPRSPIVAALLLLCLIAVVPSALIGEPASPLSTVQGIRAIIYGLGVFYLSSVWLTTPERVRRVVIIILGGSLFAALYGLRQLTFGLFEFEFERLGEMGASALEFERLNRLRVPSSFGDPLSFSFMMMTGVLFIVLARRAGMLPPPLKRLTVPLGILFAAGMVTSLTRAPMVGLFVALLALGVMSWRWSANRVVVLLLAAVTLFGGIRTIDAAVSSGAAIDPSAAGFERSMNNAMIAVWTLLPDFARSQGSTGLEELRVISANARAAGWREAFDFLQENPLGAGIGVTREGGRGLISFSPIDVGYLRYAIELGWFGLLAFVSLWIAVFGIGLLKVRQLASERQRRVGYSLVSIWIGFILCQGVSSISHTGIIAVIVWTTAGILVNLDLWLKELRSTG